jgi:hypothetical protein
MAEHLNESGGDLLRLFTLLAVGWAWMLGNIHADRPSCVERPRPPAPVFDLHNMQAAWVMATLGLLPLASLSGGVGLRLANACCVLLFALRRGTAPLWHSGLVIGINAALPSTAAPWVFGFNVFMGWYSGPATT